jgi:hypothetical protein
MKKLLYISVIYAVCLNFQVKSTTTPKPIEDIITRYDELTQIVTNVAQKVQEQSIEQARNLWRDYNFQLETIGNLIKDYKNHSGEFKNEAIADDIFTSYIPSIAIALTKTQSIILSYLEGLPEKYKKEKDLQPTEQSWKRATPTNPRKTGSSKESQPAESGWEKSTPPVKRTMDPREKIYTKKDIKSIQLPKSVSPETPFTAAE